MRSNPGLAIVFALSLGACASAHSQSQPFAYGVDSSLSQEEPWVVEVRVRDPLPVSEANLFDDAGMIHPARKLVREKVLHRSDPGLRPGWGFGIFGGSSGHVSTGLGVGIPLFGAPVDQTVTVNESVAQFEIPDADHYALTWQQWKIQLLLDDGQSSRTIEMLPPAPPEKMP